MSELLIYKKLKPQQKKMIDEIVKSVTPTTLFSEVILKFKHITSPNKDERQFNENLNMVYWDFQELERAGWFTVKKIYLGTMQVLVSLRMDAIFAINDGQADSDIMNVVNAINLPSGKTVNITEIT